MTARSVLQVFEPLEGGVPEHVVQLAAGLPAHGWEVEVAAPAGTPFLARLEEARVRVHVLPMDRSDRLSDVRSALALRKVDANRAYTVVHAHSSKAGALVRAALPGRRRLVYSPHCLSFLGGFEGLERRAYHAVEQALVARTGALIATSDWERDQVRRHLRGASAKTWVIKYGVPACDGEAPGQELVRFKEGRPLAGLISRLEPQKDPLALVRAAAILRASGVEDVRIAIVGNGSLWERLRAEIDRLGLSAMVGLFPFRGGVRPYLRAFDLFVLPSLWESLPISVLEAMACGVPVLATDVCGTSEAVTDGVTGRLVPPGDERALAAALEQLLLDEGQLAQLGADGKAAARRHFTLDRMVGDTARLYQAVGRGG